MILLRKQKCNFINKITKISFLYIIIFIKKQMGRGGGPLTQVQPQLRSCTQLHCSLSLFFLQLSCTVGQCFSLLHATMGEWEGLSQTTTLMTTPISSFLIRWFPTSIFNAFCTSFYYQVVVSCDFQLYLLLCMFTSLS